MRRRIVDLTLSHYHSLRGVQIQPHTRLAHVETPGVQSALRELQ